jgi:hypothetical protein
VTIGSGVSVWRKSENDLFPQESKVTKTLCVVHAPGRAHDFGKLFDSGISAIEKFPEGSTGYSHL